MAKRTTAQQLADAEQRLNRLRQKARREETRKKILVGALVLNRAKNDPEFHQKLLYELDQFLSDRDRPLFAEMGLPQQNAAIETQHGY